MNKDDVFPQWWDFDPRFVQSFVKEQVYLGEVPGMYR